MDNTGNTNKKTLTDSGKVLSDLLAEALENRRLSGGALAAVQEVLITAFNETDDLFIFHPELFKTAFRLIITGNSFDYAKGIADSLRAILMTDGFNRDEFKANPINTIRTTV